MLPTFWVICLEQIPQRGIMESVGMNVLRTLIRYILPNCFLECSPPIGSDSAPGIQFHTAAEQTIPKLSDLKLQPFYSLSEFWGWEFRQSSAGRFFCPTWRRVGSPGGAKLAAALVCRSEMTPPRVPYPGRVAGRLGSVSPFSSPCGLRASSQGLSHGWSEFSEGGSGCQR